MSEPTAPQSAFQHETLGARLRRIRRGRDLTLQNIADTAGLSVGYLSQIERKSAVPSEGAARRIAEALGVTVEHLRPNEISTNLATHAAERRQVLLEARGLQYERLHSTLNGELISYLVTMPAGLRIDNATPCKPNGEEFIFVQSGKLRVEIRDESYDLASRDSLHLRTDMARNLINPLDVPCCYLWLSTAELT